jgi:hypothetical protein
VYLLFFGKALPVHHGGGIVAGTVPLADHITYGIKGNLQGLIEQRT